MEIQSIAIFALIGAVCMFVITGGLVSMVSDAAPSTGNLVAGASVGGVLGAATSYFLGEDIGLPKNILSSMSGGGSAQMKVGLPTF